MVTADLNPDDESKTTRHGDQATTTEQHGERERRKKTSRLSQATATERPIPPRPDPPSIPAGRLQNPRPPPAPSRAAPSPGCSPALHSPLPLPQKYTPVDRPRSPDPVPARVMEVAGQGVVVDERWQRRPSLRLSSGEWNRRRVTGRGHRLPPHATWCEGGERDQMK